MALNNTIAFLGFLLLFMGLGAQAAGYMNLDNAWLLHVAESVVHGQKLHYDVVETNPPLIVWLMKIPVYITGLTGLGLKYSFISLVGFLSVVSLIMSFTTVKDNRIRLYLIFGLCFLPNASFGEREHLFLVFALPYIVSFWESTQRSTLYNIAIAVMAAVGFSLKPFFLLILAAIVLVKMVLNKRFFAFLTLQNIILGVLLLAYPLYLFLVEKDYVTRVLPLMLEYYGGYNAPKAEVLRQSLGAFVLGQVAFWVLFIKDRSILTRPIYISNFANLASIAVVIVQGKVWGNYFYPPNFFCLLTNAMITHALLDGNVKPLWNKVAAIIASFMIVVFVTIALSVNVMMTFGVKQEQSNEMVALLNGKADGKNVASLGFDLGAVFPEVMHSRANYALRYGCLWMIPGMYSKADLTDRKLAYREPEQKNEDERRVAAEVIADLKNNKPELVFVTVAEYHSPNIGDYEFDFVEYFSKEPEFRDLWKNYKKIGSTGDGKDINIKDIYQLQK